MSLATRCNACGTVFRVVQDQLKVSEGWVRCGRCNEVFNALEGLFDLERDEPPEWQPVPDRETDIAVGTDAGIDSGIDIPIDADPGAARRDPLLVKRMDAQLFGPRLTDTDQPLPQPEAAPPVRSEIESYDARRYDDQRDAFDRAPPRPAHADPLEAEAQAATIAHAVPEDSALFEAHGNDAPAFIRHADRRARWRSPRARASLAVAGVLLTALLGAQAAHHFRDLVAARWPQSRPALAQWCEWSGCRIDTPRRIDDVLVDSTALTRADGADAFRLAVTLRNRAAYAVAMPSIDLSLTDAAGQLVARRALTPADFRMASAALPPGVETPLQVSLSTGGKVTGYTVEIFYP